MVFFKQGLWWGQFFLILPRTKITSRSDYSLLIVKNRVHELEIEFKCLFKCFLQKILNGNKNQKILAKVVFSAKWIPTN